MPVFLHYRKEYLSDSLLESQVNPDPFFQFHQWLDQIIESGTAYPNAAVLSTCNKNYRPSSRIVLLKELNEEGFIFFTNYQSKKGRQIEENPYASLLFPWHETERQVRIEGTLKKIDDLTADIYFKTRPEGAQIAAWASPQSEKIESREFLEIQEKNYRKKFNSEDITRPPFWGGYLLKPDLFEFWQGRENRLHDRIEYYPENNKWKIRRLAP
jgi:pyridoxamine 5'-phosphate oxidase